MKKSCIRYYGGKLLAFVVSVLVLSVLVFYIARLAPGDPLVSYYGDRVEKMSVAKRAWAEEKLGLSDPIYVQYVRARCTGSSASPISIRWTCSR